MATMPEPLP